MPFAALAMLAAVPLARAASHEDVLVVVNRRSPVSREIGEYYRSRRSIPTANVCLLDSTEEEEITWEEYEQQIERPVAHCLEKSGLREKIVYIVLTIGLPLKISGAGTGFAAERASIDSELTLLYGKMRGARFSRAGGLTNPFFMKRDEPFAHTRFPIYLVARLAAYDTGEVKAMVDRSLAARNRGKFVIDAAPGGGGNDWLRNAALLLPANRVVLDQADAAVYDQRDVIGYAAWGSNDGNRQRRWLHYQWLPGAVVTDFVSTNARTLRRPPDDWTFQGWNEKQHMFGGSSQSLTADYLHEGATAATGNVYEPFLEGCVRPDYLLPAYFEGRTLGESYYLSVPLLSWQGVLLGDPLTTLGKP